MPLSETIKFRAFLSYAHADTAWAKRLHADLEAFPIDKELVGRDTPRGTVPKLLRPIFRDREDFSGGHSITDATIAALDASAGLVVLCSPMAATRPAVNEEVRLFRWRHPGRPVIPVLIGGTFPESFPPALRFEVAADGTVTEKPVTILGPDLREDADGKSLGLAKIVAGLLGVGTDEIVRRAERDRQRRLKKWIGGLSLVALAMALLAGLAEINRRDAVAQRKEAERNFEFAKDAADGLVFDIAQGLRNVEGMRADSVAKILGTARVTFDKLADAAPDSLPLQRSRSVMLNEFGATYLAQGDLAAALDAFEASLAIAGRLAAAEPGNVLWQSDLSISQSKLGEALRDIGNLDAALSALNAAIAINERLTKADPNDPRWPRELSVSHVQVGEVLRAQGNLPAALDAFKASLAIIQRLAAAEPLNADMQRDLSASQEKVGDVLLDQGNFAQALELFMAARDIRQRLVDSTPENTLWQRDLTFAHNKIGDVYREQGLADKALEAFEAALAIRWRLAGTDPRNTDWQRDVAVSYNKIGDLHMGRGNLGRALDTFKSARDIAERLADTDRSNSGWQRDLSVSHMKVGDLLFALADMPGALEAYNAALAIRERLANGDSANARWQRDLAMSIGRVATVYAKIGDHPRAREDLERGRKTIRALQAASPTDTSLARDMAWFDEQLAALK